MRILPLLVLIIPIILSSQTVIQEDIALKNGTIDIPGTLTYDTEITEQHLVIYVHGSGNVDRNGNQSALVTPNYIRALSDSLVQRGIAFYRYDKRTATASNIKKMLPNISISDFVADLLIAIDHFKQDPRFSSITLIGHSQGSLIALLAENNAVDRYISLAGAGRTIDKIIVEQLNASNKEIGEMAKGYFKTLQNKDTIDTVDPLLLGLFNPYMQKFIKYWASIDPTDQIKKVKVPTLILHGDADTQVPVTDAEALHRAKPGSKLVIIPKMNHVLKTVNDETENLASYTNEKYPLSSILVDTIANFIKP